MSSPPRTPAGIVLAGGASRRMGVDKATLPAPAGAATMVEQTVATVGSRCRPLFVVAAPGQPLPDLGAQILRDREPGLGPLAATAAGLQAAHAAGADWAFVVAVDLPLLTAEFLDRLIGANPGHHGEVVLPWDGRAHYLAALYRTALGERAAALVAAGHRSMRSLVEAADTHRVAVAAPGETGGLPELTNVNSPADLQALNARQANGAN